MSNPYPSGNGETRGLSDAQVAGTPLPSRPQRSMSNDAQFGSKDTAPDASNADGSIKPSLKGAS